MGKIIFSGLVALLFLYVASPLMIPVAMGAVFAVLFLPWLEGMEKRKISPALGSAILTIGVTLLILVPISLLLFLGAKTGFQELQAWKSQPQAGGGWVESLIGHPKVQSFLNWITSWFPMNMQELIDALSDLSRSVGVKLAELLGELVKALPGMVMALAVVVVSFYFFLFDGRRLILFIRRNSVFPPKQTDQLIHTMAVMGRSVILATVASGIGQAALEGIVVLLTGTPNFFMIVLLVFLGSFVPLIGSLPVTLGVALQQLFAGRTVAGVILLGAVGAVATIDNVIRPFFLKGRANLHPFLAFVAAFGGLQTLGFIGIFLGPIIAAVFVVTIQILVESKAEDTSLEKPQV